jgi:hypoxanthine phosphoribosyltransferase
LDLEAVSSEITKVLVTEEQIKARISELAAEIDSHYAGKELLVVGVLKGAVMFMADMSRALQTRVQMDWMAVSSYGSGTTSSGVVRILKDLDTDVLGKNVLIVEDIVDSGLTLSWLVSNLEARGAGSVEVVTLLRKPDAAKVEVDVRWVGFEIPSEFVVGYGLDWNERYRTLPGVAVLSPTVYS